MFEVNFLGLSHIYTYTCAEDHGLRPHVMFLFRLTVIEQIILRELANGNQAAFRLIIRMRNVIDNKMLDMWKGKKSGK